MDEKIALLKRWVEESDNIVFFGGAGVSTESGIPDFRSVDGLVMFNTIPSSFSAKKQNNELHDGLNTPSSIGLPAKIS